MDMKATPAPRTSLIGVRAAWTCCVCRAKAITHQLVDAADRTLDLPKGWYQQDGKTYCPATGLESTGLILKERIQ
jgi:hypothetical protein